MIGQKRLLRDIDKRIKNGKFPKFCILTGVAGSGKKMLARYIHEQFPDSVFTVYGITIDDIRQMIIDCNKLSGTCHICLLPDADGMSVQARNAILKLTEEPPKNTYIIMTLEDINNTLETIRSRATVFALQAYTPSELEKYEQLKGYINESISIADACETPGEIDLLYSYDVDEFYKFVSKTVDNIATASGANVFKLADKLKLKEDKEGYDLKLFFKLFIKICYERYVNTNEEYYMQGVLVTSTYLKDLRIKGISKQGVVDLWILDMRKEWR